MELISSLRQNTLGIALFAIVTAGLIAATQVSTQTRIADNVRAQEAKALYEIIPAERVDEDLLTHTKAIDASELGYASAKAYQAVSQGQVVAVILPVIAADGYSGDINLVVGINRDGSVSGVRVLAHKETPGLGDKIEVKKSPWILSFNDKAMTATNTATWAVKKDGGEFDQFTGATITPRAVVNAVVRALAFFEQHKTQLLTLPEPSSKEAS